MNNIRIIDSEKITVQETGEQLLSVLFEIFEPSETPGADPTVKATMRHGFPITATAEEITADLKTVLTTYVEEQERAVVNAEAEAVEAQANETIAALAGVEIDLSASNEE